MNIAISNCGVTLLHKYVTNLGVTEQQNNNPTKKKLKKSAVSVVFCLLVCLNG